MTDATDHSGPMLAADGRPLKRSLARALRAQKIRALMLIAPLLLFVLITFIAPILDMLFRSVENQIVEETMPRTVVALADYDPNSGELPGEEVFEAAYYDLFIAAEQKAHTRLGSRLNYEQTGASSLFRKTGRGLDDLGEVYQDQFKDLDRDWDKGEPWARMMGAPAWVTAMESWEKGAPLAAFQPAPGIAKLLPKTAEQYRIFANFQITEKEKSLFKEEPWTAVHTALYQDLKAGDMSGYSGPGAEMLQAADALVERTLAAAPDVALAPALAMASQTGTPGPALAPAPAPAPAPVPVLVQSV